MAITNENILFTGNCASYPHRADRKIAYINSSGICNLRCDYCFTNQNKAPIAIDRADIDFLFESFGERFLFVFTGQGDFFSGYKKSDRFLEHILSHDVRVYLDFNGSQVQELFEIDGTRLDKILQFDVSYHYETMKRRNQLDGWVANIVALSEVVRPEKWHVKAIMAMPHIQVWHEKVAFYAERVFPKTRKPLGLVLDEFDNTVYSPPVVKLLNWIVEKYPKAVAQQKFTPRTVGAVTTYEYYSQAKGDQLLCPAGSQYFKVSIDGTVTPCNKLHHEFGVTLGNLKKRQISFLSQPVSCSPINGPACLAYWERKYPV